MSKILTVKRSSFSKFTSININKAVAKTTDSRQVLRAKNQLKNLQKGNSISGKTKISFMSSSFILILVLVVSGAIYLYQVNDLVDKRYKVKYWKNQIQQLQIAGQKNKIKEAEFQSMYNIEKATQKFGLVPTNKVSYVEINGVVAMK